MRKSLKTVQKLEILYRWFINSSDIDACTYGEKFCLYFWCCEGDNEGREARCLHEKKDYDRTAQTSRIKKHYWEEYYQKPIINIQRKKIYLSVKGQRCWRLKYEKHFQWCIKLKSTHSGVEYASWEKTKLKPRSCNVA